jgi:hypothetical protein
MNTTTEQPSATPILDLLQPLPMPDMERTNGRFAFPFLTVVAAVVLTGNLPALSIPLGFLLINFLTIAIHEFGHLIAGSSVGLRFKGMRIDPFRIRVDSGKWKFKIRPTLFWGFAFMSLDKVRHVRRRLIAYVGGGPAASILCGVVTAFAGEIGIARQYDSPWPTFLEFLGIWSFIIGCMGLIPYRVRGYASDGMLLRALLCWKPEATQLIASYALSTLKGDSLFPPDYFRRWFRLAGARTKLQDKNYYENWLAYENAQDDEMAARFLERCLADSARMDDDQRDKLILEAAVLTAWRRHDAVKAELWFKRIQSLDRLHPLWQTRAKIAVLCADKQFEKANAELNGALSLIREAPDGGQRRRFEAEWIAWGEQIQQHMTALVP